MVFGREADGPGDRRLGDFTVLGELGRGGMGVVYRAQQISMGRIVALKTLPSFIGMDHDAVARFRREAEAAGRLSHPGIVPIYAVGESEGVHYYAMELVEGPSLSSIIEALADRSPERLLGSITDEAAATCAGVKPVGRADSIVGASARYAYSCAAIGADLASALTAAHRGMVIHRDIKPSNVLLRPSGMPVLVDFGLARDEMTVGLTQSGDALGTPSYMAPEQARGAHDIDARVDIYGLGALLYEMLTLRPPFDGAHAAEIMRKIVEDDPIPVRQLNPRVPPDLEKIVHTCLAKHPEDRYAAAEALEMDLRAFLQGREVIARRPSLIDRLGRTLRRERRAFLVGSTVLAFSVAAFGVMGVMARQHEADEGERVLRSALQLSKDCRPDQALEAYGRALVLLGDERVHAARRQHLPSVFEALYPGGHFEELREFMDWWPAEHRDDQWREFEARLRGLGRLSIDAPEHATIETRRLARELEPWQACARHSQLEIGDYLVRICVPGLVPVVQHAHVARDVEVAVRPFACVPTEVGEGFVLVPEADGQTASMVQETEMSRERYAQWLDSIADLELQKELEPIHWAATCERVDELDLPVTHVSFAQARTLAALHGHHLLSEREYELAATGGLVALPYPWGVAFEAERVAADPNVLTQPLPVGSRPAGRSPLGIQDLVGNAAEILAPGIGVWRVPVAGGEWRASSDKLRWDARDSLGIDESKYWAGFRVARFAEPAPDPAVAADLERRIREMFESGVVSLLHDWQVRADGSVRVDFRMLGRSERDSSHVVLRLATDGFAQRGEVDAFDGFDRPLAVERAARDLAGEVADVRIDLGRILRRGQQYQIRFGSELMPRGSLTGRGDVYSMHLPLKTVGMLQTMVRVALPKATRIESVEPTPTSLHYVDGAPIVAWHFDPDQGGVLTVPAVIHFRRDGILTEAWPLRTKVTQAVTELFASMREGDAARLAELLADDFRQLPHHRSREQTIRSYGGEDRARDVVARHDVLDVVAVGELVTAWLDVDWTVFERERDRAVVLRNWPLRVQLRRTDDAATPYRVVEIALAGRADTGEIQTGDRYIHHDLWVSLTPPSGMPVRLVRADGHLPAMQLMCLPRATSIQRGANDDVSYTLFGLRASLDETPEESLHRLTDGRWSMRPGRRLEGDPSGVLGDPAISRDAEVSHWLFERENGDGFDRESWTIVQRGQRWFFGRARASGTTEEAANETFRRYREFFDSLARAVSIRDEAFDDKGAAASENAAAERANRR